MQRRGGLLFSRTLLHGRIAFSLPLLLSFSLLRRGAGLFSQVRIRTDALATAFLPSGARPGDGGSLWDLLDLLWVLMRDRGGAQVGWDLGLRAVKQKALQRGDNKQ